MGTPYEYETEEIVSRIRAIAKVARECGISGISVGGVEMNLGAEPVVIDEDDVKAKMAREGLERAPATPDVDSVLAMGSAWSSIPLRMR